MNSPLLEKISQPSDLKKLSSQQTVQLCAEIREFLLDNVSKTGGHLASNLGAVVLSSKGYVTKNSFLCFCSSSNLPLAFNNSKCA